MRCLESSFDVLGCADLFQWLGSAGKSGALRVRHDTVITRIYFTDGRIGACSSNEPRLLLGQFLIAHGKIDDVTLQECMRRQEGTGRSLGCLLTESGRLSEADLQSVLVARAEEVVFGLFEWPNGNFRFEADHVPPKDAFRIEIDFRKALEEGEKRIQELQRIRSVFPSTNLVPKKGDNAPTSPTGASYVEGRLYDAIDGSRTLAEIALACRASEYTMGRFFLRQLELGFIKVRELREPKSDIVDENTALARLRELTASEEYEEAVEWIDRCSLKPEGDEFRAMLIAKAETGFLATAYRTQVPPDAVPRRIHRDEPPGPEAEMLTSEDVFLLDLVDGRWDVRSLSWIAPIRKVDIVRGLLRLRRHGLIELKAPTSSPNSGPRRDQTSRGNTAADIERAVSELGG
jgi:hypothetical protein